MILPARNLVISHRLPQFPTHGGSPFVGEGDIVAKCDICTDPEFEFQGQREHVKKAIDEHKRMYHSQNTMKIMLNNPL